MGRVHYTSAAGVDTVLDTVRLGAITGLVTVANQGTLGTCSIDVPDPGGVIAMRGLKRLYVEEPSYGVLWNGYIGPRDISRGEFVTGADRLISVNLNDLNTLLDNYLIDDPAAPGAGKRPAETDVARVAWLLASGFLPQVHDHGCVATTGGVDMDATDYTGQKAGDVLRDCGEKSDRQWFVYYDAAWVTDSHKDALFYNKPSVTDFTCTLAFSNAPGDADGVTTFEMASDPQPTQHQDPARIASKIRTEYTGGSVTRQDTDIGLTTSTDFYVKEMVGQSANTSSATVATAMTDQQLRDASDEEDSASFSVLLPKEVAPLVQAGHRVSLKFTHFEPQYRGFTWWRITQLTVRQEDDTHEYYRLDIEATPLMTISGFLQTVLTASFGTFTGGVSLEAAGDYQFGFAGSGSAVSSTTPAVLQDTGGWAVRVPDAVNTWCGETVWELDIPFGSYEVLWEQIMYGVGNPWWDGTGTVNDVPYVPGGQDTGCGSAVGSCSITYSVRVGGVPVLSQTVSNPPDGQLNTHAIGTFHADAASVVTFWGAFSGYSGGHAGGYGTTIGIITFASPQAVLVLRRTGD